MIQQGFGTAVALAFFGIIPRALGMIREIWGFII